MEPKVRGAEAVAVDRGAERGTKAIGPAMTLQSGLSETATPLAWFEERERQPSPTDLGQTVLRDGLTVLLRTVACSLSCTMCDLHENALASPPGPGQIASQVQRAVSRCDHRGFLKLYNGGNFFDVRSIPPSDDDAMFSSVRAFDRLIVQNHPAIGEKRFERWWDRFNRLCPGTRLEIAIGCETFQPRWLCRMDKRTTRDDLLAYVKRLRELDIDVRGFLILGMPGISIEEAIRWTRLSTLVLAKSGVRHVCWIPARRGVGWSGEGHRLRCPTDLDLLRGLWLTRRDLRARGGPAVVTADRWNDPKDDDTARWIERLNTSLNTADLDRDVERYLCDVSGDSPSDSRP